MNKIFSLLCLVASLEASAKDDPKYPVSTIPQNLKIGADVVVREDHIKFTILEKNHAKKYVHFVATIFNEKGKEYASHDVNYDKLSKILFLNGTAYDAAGIVMTRLKNKDVYDHASFDGFTLFSDLRLKSVDLAQPTYPYTVEFEYEVEYQFLYHIPGSWWGDEKVSYQNISYELAYPVGLAPRYKLFNIECTPKKTTNAGGEAIIWKFENIATTKSEVFAPSLAETLPHIVAAPTEFEFGGYGGKMDSWQHFGQWIHSLNRDRDILPEETKAKVKSIITPLKTREEKVKALYEFMQSKTRYVGIQVGIGGYQPFDASVVDKNGYGDCKALSNYMVALCKEAGISANYVLISAGANPSFDVDFPSTQFNHAIAAVPNGNDTLWLECTSQTNPFGYQGKFTGDRKALMITGDGASVVKTIQYKPKDNQQNRVASVVIDATGNAKATITTKFTGTRYEGGGLDNVLRNADELKKWIQNNTNIPIFDINSFSVEEKKDKIPSAIVTMDLTLNRYSNVSGKRLFLNPNLMNRLTTLLEKTNERKTDVVLKSNFIDTDSVAYSVPENLYPEFLPQPVKLTSRFGEYETTFQFDAGKVIYTRKLKMWKGRYPKEAYNELVDFYKNINKADNTKLVFLNKT